MGRVITPTCATCGVNMTRIYTRPTGGAFKGIGFLCSCGNFLFDNSLSAFEQAWQHLTREQPNAPDWKDVLRQKMDGE